MYLDNLRQSVVYPAIHILLEFPKTVYFWRLLCNNNTLSSSPNPHLANKKPKIMKPLLQTFSVLSKKFYNSRVNFLCLKSSRRNYSIQRRSTKKFANLKSWFSS